MSEVTTIQIKEIPVSAIITDPDRFTRHEVDNDNVEKLALSFDMKNEVPPIEVELVQTGNGNKPKYILIDGMHRLEAKKKNKEKKILARVDLANCITEADIENKDLKIKSRMKAIEINNGHGKNYTMADLKMNTYWLYANGLSKKDIIRIGYANERTIYKWLKDLTDEKKEIQEDIKKRIFELDSENMSLRKIEKVIHDEFKEEAKLHDSLVPKHHQIGKYIRDNKKCVKTAPGSNHTAAEIHDIKGNIGNHVEIKPSKKSEKPQKLTKEDKWKKDKKDLSKAHEILLGINYKDEKVRGFIVEHLLTTIARRSPEIAGSIGKHTILNENKNLKTKIAELKEDIVTKSVDIQEANAEKEALESKLENFKKECNTDCAYSWEKVRDNFKDMSSSGIGFIEQVLSAIELHKMGQDPEGLFNKILYNALHQFTTTVEYGHIHGIHSDSTRDDFRKLTELVRHIDDHKSKQFNTFVAKVESLSNKLSKKNRGLPSSKRNNETAGVSKSK